MENDKLFKDFLLRWGVEKTSDNFTANTMQAITGLHVKQPAVQDLVYGGVRKLFILFLVVVLLSIAVAGVFMPPLSIPAGLNTVLARLSNEMILNVVSFIASLWVLLFINKEYEKRKDGKDEVNTYAGHL